MTRAGLGDAPKPPVVGGPRPARDAVLGFGLAMALVAVAGLVARGVPVVASNLGAVAAVIFLFIPYFYARHFGEDLYDYGFRAAPVKEGVRLGVGIPLVMFPLFAVVFFGFYQIVCNSSSLSPLAPPGMCHRFAGLSALHVPAVGWHTVELIFIQVVVVAVPEEVFFRGFVHQLLERAMGGGKILWGGKVGPALLTSSALFAIGHLAVSPDPRRLAVFFPGLLFGWVYSRTGSVMGGVIIHSLSNVFIHLLELAL